MTAPARRCGRGGGSAGGVVGGGGMVGNRRKGDRKTFSTRRRRTAVSTLSVIVSFVFIRRSISVRVFVCVFLCVFYVCVDRISRTHATVIHSQTVK